MINNVAIKLLNSGPTEFDKALAGLEDTEEEPELEDKGSADGGTESEEEEEEEEEANEAAFESQLAVQ